MLLQKALRELDEEIQRISQIRAIVASLHTATSPTDLTLTLPQTDGAPIASRASRSPKVAMSAEPVDVAFLEESAVEVPTEEPVDAPAQREARRPRKVRLERTTRTRRPAPAEARALGGSIPGSPVFIASANVVRAAAAARSKDDAAAARKNLAAAAPPEGTLDALLRELSFRPSQGA